jgi:hypothetical protein
MALALTGAMFLTGCSTLVSLNPLVTDKEATADQSILGVWTTKNDEGTYIVKLNGGVYSIRYIDKDQSVQLFEGKMLRVGDAKFLDLIPKNDAPFHLPVHSIMRVWTEGATLRMAFLNSDWLKAQAAQQLPTQVVDGRTVITAPSEALRAFVEKAGLDPKALGDVEVLDKAR